MIFKNDKNFQVPRENRCCVCGEKKDDKLTRHHLIPSCYSSKLSIDLRNNLRKSCHLYYFEWDYCCTCRKCHLKYEKNFGETLREKLREKYGIKLEMTSYKNPFSGKPKPSEMVMDQIDSIEKYLEFREFCTRYFIEAMKPKFSLI